MKGGWGGGGGGAAEVTWQEKSLFYVYIHDMYVCMHTHTHKHLHRCTHRPKKQKTKTFWTEKRNKKYFHSQTHSGIQYSDTYHVAREKSHGPVRADTDSKDSLLASLHRYTFFINHLVWQHTSMSHHTKSTSPVMITCFLNTNSAKTTTTKTPSSATCDNMLLYLIAENQLSPSTTFYKNMFLLSDHRKPTFFINYLLQQNVYFLCLIIETNFLHRPPVTVTCLFLCLITGHQPPSSNTRFNGMFTFTSDNTKPAFII